MTDLPTYSLHRRLMVWLVAPLLIMSTAILVEAYTSTKESAQAIYDRLMLGFALSISEHTVRTEGDLLSPTVIDVLAQATNERILYKVSGPGNAFVTGYEGLPPIPQDHKLEGGIPLFYDAIYQGEPVRMLALTTFVDAWNLKGWMVIQVLQTKGERRQMVWHSVTRSAVYLLGVLFIAAAFTWIGISQGLVPLRALEQNIRRRSSHDLNAVHQVVPKEIEHVVVALNNLFERLARHISETKAFVETASHQLRTPLAALKTRIELARRHAKTEWGRKSFDTIHLDTVRAARLTEQLLSLARVTPESLGGDSEQNIDFRVLCADAAREWVKPALARDIELGFEADTGDRDILVDGNKTLLCEILNNLIDNAICYCPDGAHITIRVGNMPSKRVYLEVEDNGPGIPEQSRAKVFERFSRLDPNGGRGCGLGLPIAREIVRAHHGEIRLDTPPNGTGLLIRVELPASQEAKPISHHTAAGAPLAARSSG